MALRIIIFAIESAEPVDIQWKSHARTDRAAREDMDFARFASLGAHEIGALAADLACVAGRSDLVEELIDKEIEEIDF